MGFSVWATKVLSLSIYGSALAKPVDGTFKEKPSVKDGVKGNIETSIPTPAPPAPAEPPTEDPEKTKYFSEPGDDISLGHYDARYFKTIVSDEERRETQIHMIRAYLQFFEDHGLETWIAHGSLLGWWWNGRRLPWDWDLDAQVSDATLKHIGEKHNGTLHTYTPEGGDLSSKRMYLLDVNAYIWERTRGDGMNVIDARWIDLRNGLFIDITGLSETKPDQPGELNCKNWHKYRIEDLWPMRETTFEGVTAKVPYRYDKVLVQEYGEKALATKQYEGHTWHPRIREWIKDAPKPNEDENKERP